MNLRDTTRKIIAQLEKTSGYPVQVIEDPSLPVLASLRVARAPLPAHILSFNAPPPNSENSLDFVLCWQCALVLRLFERAPDERFQIASSPASIQQFEKILYAPHGVVQKLGLDTVQASLLRDQLLQGLVTHLYSTAVGLRVSDQLTLAYPELLEFESAHAQRELAVNRESLNDNARTLFPRETFHATHAINTAHALYWGNRLEKPEAVNPYRSFGFESAGLELLRIFESLPSDPAHDYELVDAWAESLGIRSWYAWTKYEGVK